MRVLCIGDVCGEIGCSFLIKKLPDLKRKENIDLCIANGENSADGNGITPYSAKMLYAAGVDVITGGNHTLKRKEIYEHLESDPFLLLPHNLNSEVSGKGLTVVDLGHLSVAVINLCGRVYMPEADNPFLTADCLVEKAKSDGIKHIFIDFHAEATSEKRALAEYIGDKVTAIFGTHTHVATADEQILKNGCGFITDIGMTGPIDSILGVKAELSVAKIKDGAPVKFTIADGECRLDGCIFETDNKTGKCVSIKRITVY